MADSGTNPAQEAPDAILRDRPGNTVAAVADGKFNSNDKEANFKLVEGSGWTKHTSDDDAAATANGHGEDLPQWASSATKYQWLDEYGDVGPRIPELEEQLFNAKFINRVGEKFADLEVGQIEAQVESQMELQPAMSWEDAGIHPVMLENIKLCKYQTPTAIQAYCVPAILQNRDVVAVSQTGSGKTAAYLVPILSKLMGKVRKMAAPRPGPGEANGGKFRAEPLVLVIVPTRELAIQIFDEARRLCYRSMLRPCVAYGGGPRKDQLDELKRGCDVLIGTPGRLMDFMDDSSLLSMSRVRYTVLDEADELVLPEWADDVKKLLTGGDSNQDADHRYMMFSATFPKNARNLAKEHLTEDYVRLRIGRIGATHKNIRQSIYWAEESRKEAALFDLLLSAPPARTLIFCNSKRGVDYLDDFLYNLHLPTTSIHSGRTQREREDSLRSFKNGKTPILVATGVSARGWDVSNVMHVINYDLPSAMHGGIDEYVHRIGRTGRIGNEGHASSFYNDRNEDIRDNLIKILIESGNPVPDFLEEHMPAEGTPLDFDDNSGDEDNAGDADGWGTSGDGWGTSGDGWGASGDGWGASGDNAPAKDALGASGTANATADAPADEFNAW